MMKVIWALSIAATMVLVSSCGKSDGARTEQAPPQPAPDQAKAAQQEADRIVKQQMEKLQQKEASTYPCSVFTQQEIEALAGNPLDKGSYAFNNVFEDTHEYKSVSCGWSATSEHANEVTLWVSLPKHFNSGKVECSPGAASDKISGIGDQAWWNYQKSWGIGTLRVCSEKAMLETKVTMKGQAESAAKTAAQTIAGKVLGSL
jgi:hypothetical protein